MPRGLRLLLPVHFVLRAGLSHSGTNIHRKKDIFAEAWNLRGAPPPRILIWGMWHQAVVAQHPLQRARDATGAGLFWTTFTVTPKAILWTQERAKSPAENHQG